MTTRKRDQQTAADKDKFTGPRLAKRGEHTPDINPANGLPVGFHYCRACRAKVMRGETPYFKDDRYGCETCEENLRTALAEGRKPPSDDGAPEGPVFL
jgi:hypothetical protein